MEVVNVAIIEIFIFLMKCRFFSLLLLSLEKFLFMSIESM